MSASNKPSAPNDAQRATHVLCRRSVLEYQIVSMAESSEIRFTDHMRKYDHTSVTVFLSYAVNYLLEQHDIQIKLTQIPPLQLFYPFRHISEMTS